MINEHLQKAQKSNDWIEPSDKRYTKVLNTYEKKLSEHWQKTRDKYLKQEKKKQILEVDEDPEQYEDASFDSSDYIDEALLILAFAFGEGVLIGFEEIKSRGLSVEIPKNPFEFFNDAKEIKNYSWAALSYEQQQMDEIFSKYNKLENGKDLIKQWFDANEPRLTDLMLGGVVWYGIQFGFSRATIEATGGQGGGVLLYWLTEHDNKVCDDCKALEAGNPYSEDHPLPTLPGGGKTLCGSKCRCIIDTQER